MCTSPLPTHPPTCGCTQRLAALGGRLLLGAGARGRRGGGGGCCWWRGWRRRSARLGCRRSLRRDHRSPGGRWRCLGGDSLLSPAGCSNGSVWCWSAAKQRITRVGGLRGVRQARGIVQRLLLPLPPYLLTLHSRTHHCCGLLRGAVRWVGLGATAPLCNPNRKCITCCAGAAALGSAAAGVGGAPPESPPSCACKREIMRNGRNLDLIDFWGMEGAAVAPLVLAGPSIVAGGWVLLWEGRNEGVFGLSFW